MGLPYAPYKDVPLVRSHRPDRTIHFHPVFATSPHPISLSSLHSSRMSCGVMQHGHRDWEGNKRKDEGTETGHTDIPIAIAILIAVPNNDRAALTRFLLLR